MGKVGIATQKGTPSKPKSRTPSKTGHSAPTFKRFFNEQGPILTTKYPFLTPPQIKSKAQDLWKKLPPERKQLYASAYK